MLVCLCVHTVCSLVAAGAGTISSSRVRQPWVGGSPVRPSSRRTDSGGKKRLLSQRVSAKSTFQPSTPSHPDASGGYGPLRRQGVYASTTVHNLV